MRKKSLKPWIVMLVLPWVLLFSSIIISVTVRAVQSNSSCEQQADQTYRDADGQLSVDDFPDDCPTSALETGSNILGLLFGIVAVLGIIGSPVWIVMLVRASHYNQKLVAAETAPNNSPPPPPNPAE